MSLDLERGLVLIKPDAYRAGNSGNILSIIEKNGFKLIALKTLIMSNKIAEEFYSVHRGKPFYEKLIEFMTSGKLIALAVEKENSIADMRKLVGNTNSELAEEGTIRAAYGTDNRENGVHASDSVENGLNEIAFFFTEKELT